MKHKIEKYVRYVTIVIIMNVVLLTKTLIEHLLLTNLAVRGPGIMFRVADEGW